MESIAVNARLFGTLREYVPGDDHQKGVSVTLSRGGTIHDLLNLLSLPEKEARLYFIKGRSKRLTDELNDSDEVSIFLPLSGG
jgi:molybdopterin converting factor small subunit